MSPIKSRVPSLETINQSLSQESSKAAINSIQDQENPTDSERACGFMVRDEADDPDA
jgi:hypothetical protein